VRGIDFVTAIAVSTDQKCVVTRLQELRLMGGGVWPQNFVGSEIESVGVLSGHVVLRHQEVVETGLGGHSRVEIIECAKDGGVGTVMKGREKIVFDTRFENVQWMIVLEM